MIRNSDPRRAQVVELVDALASGASGRKAVEVRVLSWAPFLSKMVIFLAPVSVALRRYAVRMKSSALALPDR